jgi:hypothetical protein
MQLDRLKEALVGIVESILVELADRRIDYRALYPAKVVTQSADGTLEVQPDDARLGSSLTKVPIRTPAPDIVITVTAGARVLIGFEAGLPNAPYASLWQSGSIISMAVGGDTDAASLASKVDALFNAFTSAVPVAQDGGAALQTAVNAVWSGPGVGSTVASTKLLLGG